jgi:hypothetical protein
MPRSYSDSGRHTRGVAIDRDRSDGASNQPSDRTSESGTVPDTGNESTARSAVATDVAIA